MSDSLSDLATIEQALLLPRGEDRERRFREDPRLPRLLPELYALADIPQRPDYHPEGDVLTHTLLAIRHLPSRPDRVLAWGTLLHDIGKLQTTREINGCIRAFGHDREGVLLAKQILARLGMPDQDIADICWLVRHHMFALSWQIRDHQALSRRHWRFIADPRFSRLLELMTADAMAAGANPTKLAEADFYRLARRRLPADPAEKDLP